MLNGHGKGDLYVEVRVQIPTKLSKRQKELLQELETTAKVDNQPMVRALLGKVKDMFGSNSCQLSAAGFPEPSSVTLSFLPSSNFQCDVLSHEPLLRTANRPLATE